MPYNLFPDVNWPLVALIAGVAALVLGCAAAWLWRRRNYWRRIYYRMGHVAEPSRDECWKWEKAVYDRTGELTIMTASRDKLTQELYDKTQDNENKAAIIAEHRAEIRKRGEEIDRLKAELLEAQSEWIKVNKGNRIENGDEIKIGDNWRKASLIGMVIEASEVRRRVPSSALLKEITEERDRLKKELAEAKDMAIRLDSAYNKLKVSVKGLLKDQRDAHRKHLSRLGAKLTNQEAYYRSFHTNAYLKKIPKYSDYLKAKKSQKGAHNG